MHPNRQHRQPANTPPGPRGTGRRRGFSLTELLVVISIIVVLVGLLLVALGTVRGKALRTDSEATMRAFSQGCDTFQMEHGYYPGMVPEESLLASPGRISGTENALLHLMGGARVKSPTSGPQASADFDAFAGTKLTFGQGPTMWELKFDANRIGEGPIIDGKPYAPYFNPSPRDVAVVAGQVQTQGGFGDAPTDLPDLVDAWGQPIIYMRRIRRVGSVLVGPANPSNQPQFMLAGLEGYLESEALGEFGQDQAALSTLNIGGGGMGNNSDQIRYDLFRLMLEHPSVRGQPRGEFMLLAAGDDGVYVSVSDGPGSHDDPIDAGDLQQRVIDKGAGVFKDYDDIWMYGGG
jgi:prepilin-type N-terminal cleavage/methylation domain-containing protein